MTATTAGLHHTTGITGDAQGNVDFYAGLLGLHLVMRTVNHEDPGTLHLFYGDADARPGSLLTFFAWPDTARGRRGSGQATEIGLLVPLEHTGFWVQRFLERGVRYGGPTPDGERTLLLLHDSGGDETSLLAFAREAAPTASLLTVRGRSLEEGSPRFFRRHANGFDQEQLSAEADALSDFVTDAADLYGFDAHAVIAFGYSNGANIALATLARNPGRYAGAILLRPAMILAEPPATNLAGTPVLALLGDADAHAIEAEDAVAYLQTRGAEVHAERQGAGHDLTPHDGAAVNAFLRGFAQNGS